MEELICNKCGPTTYHTILKANNQVAYCNKCGGYIKNIPHATEAKFYFGKYKDKSVTEIEDISYLKWALKEMKLSAKMRTAIQKQIDKVEFINK